MPKTDDTRVELLQGTLDLIVLRALATMGPLHAYALATRLEQVADHPLTLNQGTLYPALVRLEQRGWICLLYTSDAADERSSVDLGGRRIIKKKKKIRDK